MRISDDEIEGGLTWFRGLSVPPDDQAAQGIAIRALEDLRDARAALHEIKDCLHDWDCEVMTAHPTPTNLDLCECPYKIAVVALGIGTHS